MQRVKLIAGVTFLGFLLAGASQAAALCAVPFGAGFDWSGWEPILKKHVKPTTIAGVSLAGFDYKNLQKSRAKFDKIVSALSKYDPSGLSGKAKLAFWINVYNVGAVKMVLDHPKIKSLNDIGPKKGAVWKMDALTVGGKSYSLDAVENEILRKLDEPRIHFAIVCASVSCPDIRPEAYRAKKLEKQLEEQTRSFLSNSKKGMSFAGGKLMLTKLFEWFANDFGGVKNFIAGYLPKDAPADWRKFELGYLEYNWDLNGL
jgi:hypothetical protein